MAAPAACGMGGGAAPARCVSWGAGLHRPCRARAFRVSFRRKKRGLRQAAAHIAGPCLLSQPAREPPRAPAPVAAGASPRPPRAPCARTSPATRTAPAFRASFRRKKRGLGQEVADAAGPCARTSRQRFGGPQTRNLNRRGGRWPRPPLVSVDSFGSLCHLRWQQPTGLTLPSVPSKMYSYRPASPGGRGVCAQGRKHSLRRPPPGEVNGAAVDEVGGRRNPSEKIGASRAFPTRSYSILASASLTSSIRRATWEGVSTGWLNSTVWFTVTGAAACVCAASRS